MCIFITATMAPRGDETAVRRLAESALLNWEPLVNPVVLSQLHPGERTFSTTRGTCDCGTEIGISHRSNGPARDPDISRSVQNFRKKGWSEAKIDRWVAQTAANSARRREAVAVRLSGPHPEIDRWIQFLSAVLTGYHADWIGILVHWYGGGVADEALAIGTNRWLSTADLTEDCLLGLEDDTLYRIARQPGVPLAG